MSKFSLVVIALGSCGIIYASEEVINEQKNFACDKNNFCSSFFEGKEDEVKKFCDPSNFSVVWKKGSQKYLFQCRGRGTLEEGSKNWIADAGHNVFFRVDYGRFYNQDALIYKSDVKIPDRFRARPLCHQAIDAKLRASDFVLLDKRTSDDDQSPYCYEPTYLMISGEHLFVLTNEGKLKNGDAEHQVHPASAAERKGLKLLLKSLH